MPEPKKPRRVFENQTGASVERLLLVDSRPSQADINEPGLPEANQAARKTRTPDPELIEKLISFIKSI